jgi:hypothetical protein
MLQEQQPDTAVSEPRTVSRRKLIVTGASLAAAGVAVGAAASIPFSSHDTAGTAAPESPSENPKLPVMVHLRDAVSGDFDVFVGTTRFKLNDRAFAARLTNAVTAG